MRNRGKQHRMAETVGLALTLVIAISLGFFAYSSGGNIQNPKQATGYPVGGRPILSLDILGQPSTLAQANQIIGVDLRPPTYLPSGAKLVSVRSTTNEVGLVYYASNLPQIPFYTNATLIVLVLRDNSTYTGSLAPSRQPAAFVSTGGTNQSVSLTATTLGADRISSTTVSGHLGRGYNPSDSNGYHDSGQIEWWTSGLHYVILADLPLNELLKIGQSMNT